MPKTVTLKVTSAFLVGGKIARVGEIVEVGYADAKDLLHRGKAVLAVVDAAETDAGETQPAEAETQDAESETQAAEAETQPADPAPAKGKGKKAK